MQVHFEAKRYGLRGLNEAEMPKLRQSLRERWPTLIPLALLIFVLVSGRTPYLAAFCGISSCAIVGLSTRALGNRPANLALLVGLHAVLGGLVFGGLQHEGAKLAVFACGVLVAKGFTWYDFSVTFIGCILGISLLAAALSKFLLVEMRRWEQLLCGLRAVLMVVPGLISTLIGAAVAAPVLLHQWTGWRKGAFRA